MAHTEFRNRELAYVDIKQTRKGGGLSGQDAQRSLAQVWMSIHHEHEPGHQSRCPANTIVCRLIRLQIVVFDRLNERIRLRKGQANALPRKRID
jgi:hypothetical protein